MTALPRGVLASRCCPGSQASACGWAAGSRPPAPWPVNAYRDDPAKRSVPPPWLSIPQCGSWTRLEHPGWTMGSECSVLHAARTARLPPAFSCTTAAACCWRPLCVHAGAGACAQSMNRDTLASKPAVCAARRPQHLAGPVASLYGSLHACMLGLPQPWPEQQAVLYGAQALASGVRWV